MKLIRKIAILLGALCISVSAVACSASAKSDYMNGSGAKPDSQQGTQRPAGLLTACAWNDNEHYDLWNQLFYQGDDENGKFLEFTGKDSWNFNSQHRIKVAVTAGENNTPVAGAEVVCKANDDTILFRAISDAAGIAYLFTDEAEGSVTATSGECTAQGAFTTDVRELTLHLEDAAEKLNRIELMFVVDVTGSMGDELNYLKNEIADVVEQVSTANDGVEISLALLFYRDHGDKEVFSYYDFTNVNDPEGLSKQQAAIDLQNATGGGDWPEAVDEALELAIGKQWGTGSSTKIIFQVLDAPPHEEEDHRTTFHSAVLTAAEKGIRICPVVCSGAGLELEYLMRQSAIYTGGTFVYLTDDSGIGNSHYDPDLPDTTVEALNSLMVRLINGYHSGAFEKPVDWRQEIGNSEGTTAE